MTTKTSLSVLAVASLALTVTLTAADARGFAMGGAHVNSMARYPVARVAPTALRATAFKIAPIVHSTGTVKRLYGSATFHPLPTAGTCSSDGCYPSNPHRVIPPGGDPSGQPQNPGGDFGDGGDGGGGGVSCSGARDCGPLHEN